MTSLAKLITELEPGEELHHAWQNEQETDAIFRLLDHPQVKPFPRLGTNEVGVDEITSRKSHMTFHESAEGLVLRIETPYEFITLFPNDTLVRRAKD